MKKASLAASAALAAFLVCAPARAAVYELASEWMTISFRDGGKDMLLFTHLPDSDIFMHLQDYSTDTAIGMPGADVYVPLLQLVQPGATAKGPLKSLLLKSRPTPYKMLIRFDLSQDHHVIHRPPDFTTPDSTTSATVLSVFGVKTDHPDSFLVMVQPEKPEGPAGGLGDVELAAVNSMDASERAAAVAACKGEPSDPAALDCWREKIRLLLNRSQAEASSQGLSPFEQRYIQNRLSRKGYEQFQSLRSSSGEGGKLSLASMIIAQDIAASSAAAPKPKKYFKKTAVVPVVVSTPPRPVLPAVKTAPAPVRWGIILLLLLALAVVGAVLARR